MILRAGEWCFTSTRKCASNTLYETLPGQKMGMHKRAETRLAPLHFTVVRSPYTRAASLWGSTCLRGHDNYGAVAEIINHGGSPKDFRDFCKYILGGDHISSRSPWLFCNQSDWHKGQIIDEFVKLEELPDALTPIIGERLDLPILNSSKKKPIYTEETCELIREWAEDDFTKYYD